MKACLISIYRYGAGRIVFSKYRYWILDIGYWMLDQRLEIINLEPGAKILIIQLRRIGDVLLTTPVIRALRKKFPQAQLDFLVEKAGSEVLKGNPYLSNILIYDKKEQVTWLRKVRASRYDVILDFLRNPRTAWITLCSGARYRVGFKRKWRDFAYNVRVAADPVPKYVPAFKLDLLKPLGIQDENINLDLVVDEQSKKRVQQYLSATGVDQTTLLVGISPTSRRPARRWRKEGFAEVADHLIRTCKAKVIFLWGPGEEEYVDEVIRLMKEKPLKHPPFSIAELVALIGQLKLFVSNDNGPLHIAQAFGIPTVAVFGPTQSVNWNAPGEQNRAVKVVVGCLECNKQECAEMECMKKLSSATVIDAIELVKFK